MQIDRQLLEQVLHTPESRDVRDSPIVTAIILSDARNAGDLAPYLDQVDSNVSTNARLILCLFDVASVPHLVAALRNVGLEGRKEGIDILWSLLLGENNLTIRDTLTQIAHDMEVLLDDKRPLPDQMPDFIERDFQGRVCDLAFIMLQSLINDEYDQSLFRSLKNIDRDDEIARLRRRGFGLHIA